MQTRSMVIINLKKKKIVIICRWSLSRFHGKYDQRSCSFIILICRYYNMYTCIVYIIYTRTLSAEKFTTDANMHNSWFVSFEIYPQLLCTHIILYTPYIYKYVILCVVMYMHDDHITGLYS